MNETCLQCHEQQRGPFVFEHLALREGCTVCHSPHGSPNQRMLKERNHTLCLKCHLQDQSLTRPDRLTIGGGAHSTGRLSAGACWAAGCHEAVHGSNVSNHLRN
jgi:predicted CXXCH cytochrome family protein